METTNYIIANNPQRMGEVNSLSSGDRDEMLQLRAIYFQIEELYNSENIGMVMIKYE